MDWAPLVYQRSAFLAGQWWLPLTSQFVHLGTVHALANLVSACALAGIFRPWVPWRLQAAVLAGAVVAVALMLVGDPQCAYYAGASGALHGWTAGGALLLLQPTTRPSRTPMSRTPWFAALASPGAALIALGLLVGLSAKLVLQSLQTTPLVAWGIPVYGPSHVAGAVGGAIAGAWLLARRWRATKPSGRKPRQPQG